MSKTFEEWYPTVYNESVESSRKMPDGFAEKQATEMAWLIWDRSCFKHADGWDEPFSDGWSVVPFLLSRNLIEQLFDN